MLLKDWVSHKKNLQNLQDYINCLKERVILLCKVIKDSIIEREKMRISTHNTYMYTHLYLIDRFFAEILNVVKFINV